MSETFTIEQPDGYPPIHVRREGDGTFWVAAGDEPGLVFRPVDEIVFAMLENVRDGNAVAQVRPDGEFEFKVTPQGIAKVENMISTNAEHAAIYADAQRWGRERG